jgi:hypothetical protein
VSPRTDGDIQLMISRELDRTQHIVGTKALRYNFGILLDRAIPDLFRDSVFVRSRSDHGAFEGLLESGDIQFASGLLHQMRYVSPMFSCDIIL